MAKSGSGGVFREREYRHPAAMQGERTSHHRPEQRQKKTMWCGSSFTPGQNSGTAERQDKPEPSEGMRSMLSPPVCASEAAVPAAGSSVLLGMVHFFKFMSGVPAFVGMPLGSVTTVAAHDFGTA